MPKYRQQQPDIVSFTNRISQRVAKLERNPRALATSVDRGALAFNGGQFIMNTGNSDDDLPFLSSYSAPTTLTNITVLDNFDRVESSGWGDPSFDGNGYSFATFPWTISGGTGTDYTVAYTSGTSGLGSIKAGSVAVSRIALNGVDNITDQSIQITFSIPVIPTGAPITFGAVLRQTSFGRYHARIKIQTDSTIVMEIVSQTLPAGVSTTMATTIISEVFAVGQKYNFYAEAVGSTIRTKLWRFGKGTSDFQLQATDVSSLYSAGKFGVRLNLETSNTNTLPVIATVYNVKAYVNTNQVGVNSLTPDNSFQLFRHDSVAPGIDFALVAFQFADYTYDPAFLVSTLYLNDRYGSTMVSDAVHGRGFSDPRLPTIFFDPSATKSTTSGSFVNFASCFWYLYHPKLRVRVLLNVPASTTYEVRVNESGGSQQALVSVTNSFGYVDLLVDREKTSLIAAPNGNIVNLDLEWRRVSGAGTATMVIADVIGIDL